METGHDPDVSDRSDLLRLLPSVDRVLATPTAEEALEHVSRPYLTDAIRKMIEEARHAILTTGAEAPDAGTIAARAVASLDTDLRLRTVVNATGVVIHTNLGRALLADEAVDAVASVAAQPCNLEYDLREGRRGERDDWIVPDLLALTAAEAATVVNNNAAAILLALNTMAAGREVIVSRGELIEIGGSFRIPDLIGKSQAILREVGTTNRTHARDYENAISERTGLLLKVQPSNYRIVGFTHDVPLERLVEIGRAHGIPVMEDLGSGALVDLSAYGLPTEPVVRDRVRLGADVISFSGDKLLGGPQAGILTGNRTWIERISQNPLKRALRCDKLTLAALAATLRLYRTAPDLTQTLPALRALTRPLAELQHIGEEAALKLRAHLGFGYRVDLVSSQAEVGSGSLPTETIPSKALAVSHTTLGPDAIASRFRASEPPIIGRIQENRFLLDLRCIYDIADLIPSP